MVGGHPDPVSFLEIFMIMSLRAYARHRGVALSAVQKEIATGRIHPETDGRIVPAKADAQWDRHTRPAQPATARPLVAPASFPPVAVDDSRGVDYHKARAVRETYAARLAKLEFEERSGKLLNTEDVQVKHFNLARLLRERMQQIPRKVAPEIVALVVADPDVRGVTDILDVAIREALEDLSR